MTTERYAPDTVRGHRGCMIDAMRRWRLNLTTLKPCWSDFRAPADVGVPGSKGVTISRGRHFAARGGLRSAANFQFLARCRARELSRSGASVRAATGERQPTLSCPCSFLRYGV